MRSYKAWGLILCLALAHGSRAQTGAFNDCFWRADTSTWSFLQLDARQVALLDSLRQHHPQPGTSPQEPTRTSGDRILSNAAEEDERINQQKDNAGRVVPSAGSRKPTGERVDGQEHAPTDGGQPGSTVRSTAEVQEAFSNNSGGSTRPPEQQPPIAPAPDNVAPPVEPGTTAPAPATRGTAERTAPASNVQGDVEVAMRNVLTREQWSQWQRWCAGR